jgi:hypothetical protein
VVGCYRRSTSLVEHAMVVMRAPATVTAAAFPISLTIHDSHSLTHGQFCVTMEMSKACMAMNISTGGARPRPNI